MIIIINNNKNDMGAPPNNKQLEGFLKILVLFK